MTRCLWVGLLLMGAMGCKRNETIPGSVLPREKMEKVLADMMKADQFLSDYVLNRDTTRKRETESLKIYSQVFAMHNISAEKFYESFNFYKLHPQFLQPILDSLSKPVEATVIDQVPLETVDTIKAAPGTSPPYDAAGRRRVDSTGKRRLTEPKKEF